MKSLAQAVILLAGASPVSTGSAVYETLRTAGWTTSFANLMDPSPPEKRGGTSSHKQNARKAKKLGKRH